MRLKKMILVRNIRWMLTCNLILLFSWNTFSQVISQQVQTQIDSVILKAMHENKIVGLSLGIVSNGKVIFVKGYGTRQVHKQEPVDSVTNFLTCSISKLFTATAIMQLVQQGKININNKLTDYVPEFEMKDQRYKQITIEQMLTHTSGLPNIRKRNFINPANDSLALTEFALKLKKKKLDYPPGVQLSAKTYSNTAYDLLGLVIERVSHQPYVDYINQNLLQPAGMTYSSFLYQKIPVERRSAPHIKNWLTGKVKKSNYYPDIPQDKPCGNLNSCASDLCRWMICNMAIYNSTSSSSSIISRQTLLSMWTTTHQIPPYKTSIGLGWWVVDSEKYGKYLFHVGNDPGFSATLNIFPEKNLGIVILTNGEYPFQIVWNKIPFQVIDQLLAVEKK